jgi:shikimate dehydrogenase
MVAPVTTVCGSLSLHPVSLGAAMHRAGYAALGLDFVYLPFGVTDVRGAITGMRALGIRGLGISMPYKLEVMAWLDAIEPAAAAIGAVNTVVNDAGRLTGHNTDAWGAVRALEERLGALQGTRLLLLGAGGAARAVAHALRGAGVELAIANRDLEKARALAAATGAEALSWDAMPAALAARAVVVNATSMGMAEVDAASPIPASALRADLCVMDIVYKPVRTRLVEEAAARGATVVDGTRMLLFQAMRQFELYTGREAPRAAMERALLEQLGGPLSQPLGQPRAGA